MAGQEVVQGKYEQPSLAVSATGSGVVWIHGYVGEGPQQTAWLDRTTDGETWTAGPARTADGSNPESAQSFTFLDASVVAGYGGGTNGLWLSRDAGATWRQALRGWNVISVAKTGSALWLIGAHCLDFSCAPQLLRGDSSSGQFPAAPSQPPAGGGLLSVFAVSGQALAITELAGKSGEVLVASSDGGRTWQRESLPCAAEGAYPGVSSAVGVLWVTCVTEAMAHDPAEGLRSTYRSVDLGRTWADMTKNGQPQDGLIALPVSQTMAWGEDVDRFPQGLVRTTDGGAHWSRVTTPWPSDNAAYIALAPVDADTAWCLAQIADADGYRFVLYTTRDAGQHWEPASLPIAPSVLSSPAPSSPPSRP